jgi:hypothetical protein
MKRNTSLDNNDHGIQGKIGYALLWLLGVPLPVVLVLYLFFGD